MMIALLGVLQLINEAREAVDSGERQRLEVS
jgi:hypothetical protein